MDQIAGCSALKRLDRTASDFKKVAQQFQSSAVVSHVKSDGSMTKFG